MTTEQIAIAKLEATYAGWQVWVVRRVVGGPVWCARKHDEPTARLHAGSPEKLAEYLDEEASE